MKQIFLLMLICQVLGQLGAETSSEIIDKSYTSETLVFSPNSENPRTVFRLKRYRYRERSVTTSYTLRYSYSTGNIGVITTTETFSSRSDAENAQSNKGGSISENQNVSISGWKTGEETADNVQFSPPAGGEVPGQAEARKTAGQEASTDGLQSAKGTASFDSAMAIAESLDASDGSEESDLAEATESAEVESIIAENYAEEADEYGDPVKLASGSLAHQELDLSIVLPGRSENLSIERIYDSGNSVEGFFGLGWRSNLEGRVIFGRDAPHWASIRTIDAEIIKIEALKQELESLWGQERVEIDNSIQVLQMQINELKNSISAYNRALGGQMHPTLRIAYEEIVLRFRTALAGLQPLLPNLQAYRERVEESFTTQQSALEQSIVELNQRRDRSQRLISENDVLHRMNIPKIFPGQSETIDRIGRDAIIVVFPFGGKRIYHRDPSKDQGQKLYYSSHAYPLDRLILENGVVRLFEPGRFSTQFDLSGRLHKRYQGDQLLYSLRYSDNPNIPGPIAIDLYGDRLVTLEWTNGAEPSVSRILYENRELRSYSYDGEYLVAVKFPDNSKLSYKYNNSLTDGGHRRLKQIIYSSPTSFAGGTLGASSDNSGREGHRNSEDYTLTYNYDSQMRVVRVVDNQGFEEFFAYTTNGNRIISAKYTNSKGLIENYEFNDRMQEISVSSSYRADLVYTRDTHGRITQIWNTELNARTHYEYSALGYLERVIGPLGEDSRLYYDEQGRLIKHINPDGISTRYTYDNNWNIHRAIFSDDTYKEFTYNSENLLTRYSDELGNIWKFDYNRYGYRTRIIDPLGRSTELVYNEFGQITSRKNAEGSIWRYEYDVFGRKKAEINPIGQETRFSLAEFFDESEPIEKITIPIRNQQLSIDRQNPAGVEAELKIQEITWNKKQLPIEVIWEDGGIWQYEYTAAERLSLLRDPAGRETRYSYNNRGLLASTTYPDGRVEERKYDSRGLLIELISINIYGGRDTWKFGYNELSDLVQTIAPDGLITKYTRDMEGRVTRLIEVNPSQNPQLQRESLFSYDGAGNILTIQSSDSTQYRYEYDRESRLVQSINPLGYELRHTYSGLGRSTKDNLGQNWEYNYDSNLQISKAEDPMGQEINYAYSDVRGKRTRTIRYPGGEQIIETQDEKGQLIHRKYADGTSETFSYNSAGQLIAESRGNKSWNYSYDLQGKQILQKNFQGMEINYRYDEMNRLVQEIQSGIPGNPENTEYRVKYSYNPNPSDRNFGESIAIGSITRSDNLGSVLTKLYDAEGRILSIENAEGRRVAEYRYDGLGRLTAMSTPQIENSFTWDEQDRMIASWDSMTGIDLRYEYDAEGKLTALEDSSGYRREMTYNIASELIALDLIAGNIRETISIERDGFGRIQTLQANNGEVTQAIQYNEVGVQSQNRLSVKGSSSFMELYEYDENFRQRFRIDDKANLSIYEYNLSSELDAQYNPYSASSNTAPIWKNLTTSENAKLSDLWQSSGESAPFTSYQAFEAVNISNKSIGVTDISLDARGSVQSWVDNSGIHSLDYDNFGRLAKYHRKNLAVETECYYIYDALHRLVLEACEVRNSPDNTYKISTIFLHATLLPEPLAQFEFKDLPNTSSLNLDLDNSLGSLSLETGYKSSKYRFSFPKNRSSDLNSGITPSIELFDARSADRSIWYAYIDGKVSSATVLKKGGVLSSYLLSADARVNLRAIANTKGNELILRNYHTYGREILQGQGRTIGHESGKGGISNSDNRNSKITETGDPESELLIANFIGFASVLQNQVTGLCNFGYRFYSPQLQRFLSADPLRHGYDWFAYTDGDPINYIDVLGLEVRGRLTHNKTRETITGYLYDDTNDNLESLIIVDMQASSRVRHREYPTKDGSKNSKPLLTISNSPKPYIAEPFPNGVHKITGVREYESYEGQKNKLKNNAESIKDEEEKKLALERIERMGDYNEYIGTVAFTTDVNNEVVTYRQVNDEWEEYGTEMDTGFLIHGGVKNDFRDTTLGCIRMYDADIQYLARYVVKNSSDNSASIKLIVTD